MARLAKTNTGKLADLANMVQARSTGDRVRSLNDDFRKSLLGGKVFLTSGV